MMENLAAGQRAVPPDLGGTSSRMDDEVTLLTRFLRERDAACPVCGYNLRNLTIDRCPECGRTVHLTVGTAEPYLRLLMAAMVPMLLCAGVGVCLLWVVISVSLTGGEMLWDPWQAIAFALFIASIPIALLLVALWRRFLRQTRPTQLVMACVSIGYVVVSFAALIIAIVVD